MGYTLEPLELYVKSFGLPPSEDLTQVHEVTYLFALVYEEQDGIGCYVGTIWNATDERPVPLENEGTRFVATSKESAYRWYEEATKVKVGS